MSMKLWINHLFKHSLETQKLTKKWSENAANWVDFLKLMYVIYQNQLNLLWNRLEHNLAKIYQKCMYAKAGAKIYQNSLNCDTLVTSLKQKIFLKVARNASIFQNFLCNPL